MFSVMNSLSELFEKSNIEIDDSKFVYFIDWNHIWTESGGNILGNITPDYETFLHTGLYDMKYSNPKSKFEYDRNGVVEIVITYIKRIQKKVSESSYCNADEKVKWFENMLQQPANHFDEAIQRILFINQLIWQSNHRLIGLGHWDKLLGKFYEKDLETGKITYEEAYSMICEVLKLLHRDYKFKSNMLLGDTGQIIVIGLSDEEGNYIYNELTEILIKAIEEVQQPDPKVLLRVNRNTPRTLMNTALDCIETGCGSPLLSNDEAIIPRLVEYGIPKEDAVNYTVSACWEPLIGGKDASLNNVTTLNFMKALSNLFSRENLDEILSFEKLVNKYFEYLSWNLNAIKRILSFIQFQYDPVLSLFMGGCYENKCDIAHGGAKYHDIGITTVALSNTVNALLNIKELVYEKRNMSLSEIKVILDYDFKDNEVLRCSLIRKQSAYGNDDLEVIALTNRIIRYVTKETMCYRTKYRGKLKFGLSAPTYIDAAKGFPATFDGRHKGEAFSVHISNEKVSSYTELLNFASQIDYDENRFNGNVVDLMVIRSFLHDNREKFIDLLLISIKNGVFQMQMNVTSSKTLIAAKKNPENYANLIVRVWGFSAYMIDLPEEYKDVLIARALENEMR